MACPGMACPAWPVPAWPASAPYMPAKTAPACNAASPPPAHAPALIGLHRGGLGRWIRLCPRRDRRLEQRRCRGAAVRRHDPRSERAPSTATLRDGRALCVRAWIATARYIGCSRSRLRRPMSAVAAPTGGKLVLKRLGVQPAQLRRYRRPALGRRIDLLSALHPTAELQPRR